MSKSPNRLLDSLPADAFSAISPYLKIVELKFGDVIAEAVQRPVDSARFGRDGDA